jgi:hypothetical protein
MVRRAPRSGTLHDMDHIPSPRELTVAARACVFMAYAAGLAGVAAGTIVLREDELAFAVILWTITFAVGAVLMGVSLLIRALSGVSAQLSRMQGDLEVLTEERARERGGSPPPADRDPWLRH